MDAFLKRVETGRDKQKKLRKEKLQRYAYLKEHNAFMTQPSVLMDFSINFRILQRYQNIKSELVTQQNLESIKEARNVSLVYFWAFACLRVCTFLCLYVCIFGKRLEVQFHRF